MCKGRVGSEGKDKCVRYDDEMTLLDVILKGGVQTTVTCNTGDVHVEQHCIIFKMRSRW